LVTVPGICMKTLAQIGAGNIGRSFIGQLFSRAGYEVVFIDIADDLVNELNRKRCYTVEIRDRHSETIIVENVRAVSANDRQAAAHEIARADIAGTAVGPAALRQVYPLLACALQQRLRLGQGPLDLIICENLRHAADAFRQGLAQQLPPAFPLEAMVGLVETSIGKMVPIMTEQQRREDPLRVFAEAYNTLIVDAQGFKCGVPDVPGLEAKLNMAPYVDRKLLVHNLGHALTAYLGYLLLPEATFIWEAVGDERVLRAARAGMWESGRALIAEYPDEFDRDNISRNIEDLLLRFANRALGDTIFRVGRDIRRKLCRGDRLIGALLLDAKHSVAAPYTAHGAAAAMLFRGRDEQGQLLPDDEHFAQDIYSRGPAHVLDVVCELDHDRQPDPVIRSRILEAYEYITTARRDGRDWLSALLESAPSCVREE